MIFWKNESLPFSNAFFCILKIDEKQNHNEKIFHLKKKYQYKGSDIIHLD